MDAYKCDVCQQFFEGESSRSHDLDLGDFMLRFSVARKQEPVDGGDPPSLELGQPEMIAKMLAVPFVQHKRDLSADGRELWAADLCPVCTLAIFKQALIKAQADSILEALTDSVGEFHE